MSRAFVREDAADGLNETLPDRQVSPHRNLVTKRGLEQIEAELARLRAEDSNAREADDAVARSRVARDLRYWTARLANAELVEAPADPEQVGFGSTVTFRIADGAPRTLTLVGEDEATPEEGTIAWVSPLGQALFGLVEGEVGEFRGEPVTLVRIDH